MSYRREDAAASAGRIYDELVNHFGNEQVFMDVDRIEIGEDFIQVIEEAVSQCDVLLAVIGKDWLQLKDERGIRLLYRDGDFVCAEIRAALQRKIRVIPVLVEGAKIPDIEELPNDIKFLSRRNAIEIRHTHFKSDTKRFIEDLTRILQKIAQTNLQTEQESHRKVEEARIKKELEQKRLAEALRLSEQKQRQEEHERKVKPEVDRKKQEGQVKEMVEEKATIKPEKEQEGDIENAEAFKDALEWSAAMSSILTIPVAIIICLFNGFHEFGENYFKLFFIDGVILLIIFYANKKTK